MKTRFLFFSLIISGLLFSCKSKNSGTSSSGDSTVVDNGKPVAVCVWDNISLKESPDEKGKWICAISLGEKVEYLDNSKEDNSGKKPVVYYKVKLKDNKEGWCQSDFIALNSKSAVFNQDAEVYSRPDLLTKSGKKFSKMDIIAVTSEQNDFLEIKGKRKDGKWIETGWVKKNTVSYADVDVAVAKFAGKALQITDSKKRAEAIEEIVSNPDFSQSVFLSSLKSVDESTMTPAEDTTKLAE